MQPAPLQFGAPEPGVKYRDRPAVFGIAERDGKIAVIRITRLGVPPFHDLPGGGIEPGESEARALAREFVEETGLIVSGGEVLARANQYMVKSDGEPANNRSVVLIATVKGFDPDQKIEDDHQLEWVDPDLALRMIRHDSHAWAIACWIRRRHLQTSTTVGG